MAAAAKQVGGRAIWYHSVPRGRPPAFYEGGHGTTKVDDVKQRRTLLTTDTSGADARGNALERVGASVVALYSPRGKRVPKHVGSGVLARIDRTVAVLTAAHVHLGSEEVSPGELFVAFNHRLVPLVGQVYRTECDAASYDTADCAVMHILDDSTAAHLSVGAIDLAADLLYFDLPVGTPCMLRGYPHRYGEKVRNGTLNAHWFTWAGYAASVGDVPKLPPGSTPRIAMHVPLDKLVDMTGKPSRSVSTSGCSGGGMWALLDDATPLLAGIFTEVRGDYFVGTSPTVHLQLLHRFAPELFSSERTA